MKRGSLITLILIGIATVTAHGAWEKVRLPEGAQEKGIAFMEFANANLGYASIQERIWPQNFLIYRDGRWTLTRLGMFQGYAQDISLLPGGYGWLGGRHGGLHRLFYSARNTGGGSWQKINNPYSEPPGYEGIFFSLSVAAVEDVWCLFIEPVRFLRYKDGVWKEIPNPLPRELKQPPGGVCFVNENEGWVSGSNGQAHYVNGRWEFVPGLPIYRLEFTAPDDGWGTGPGGVYHYDGSSWRISLKCPPGYYAEAISFYDRNNGWACLNSGSGPGRGFKYESGIWHEIALPKTRGFGYASAVSASDAWFLGSEYEPGKGYVTYSYHWYTEPNVEPTSLGKIKTLFK